MKKSIQLRDGKTVKVVGTEIRRSKSGKQQTYYQVECGVCGHEFTGQLPNIQKRKHCPSCQPSRIGRPPKPAALKTDNDGNCIAICEIGQVEFIREYQEKHSVSERGAVRAFIEAINAHVPVEDPALDGLTEGSVSARVRRQTGRKKDRPLLNVRRTATEQKDEPEHVDVQQADSLDQLESTPETVQQFLDKHMPGYEISKKPEQCASCGAVEFYHGYFCEKCDSRGA